MSSSSESSYPDRERTEARAESAFTGWSSSPWCTSLPMLGRANISRLIDDLEDAIGVLEANRGRLTATEIRILSFLRVARADLGTELTFTESK